MATNWYDAGLDDNEQTYSNDLITDGTVGGTPLNDLSTGQLSDALNLNQGSPGEGPESEDGATQGDVVVNPSDSGLSVPSIASLGAAGVALLVGFVAIAMGGEG